MNLNIFCTLIVIYGTFQDVTAKLRLETTARNKNALIEHTKVTDSLVFPYVVAILKKLSYLCAGALLDDKWVLTAADSFYLLRESKRIIRVRLGSINYKKGGVLAPIKTIELHPYFDDSKPVYDIALIRLAHRVRLTPTLYPIRLQTKLKEVTATHFIMTSWTPSLQLNARELRHPISMDAIKQQRMLTVSHLHPSGEIECKDELYSLDVNDTGVIMCLDNDLKADIDPCWRDTGAPVVLNGILWGIVSSWHLDDCESDPGPTFVNLVAADYISSWIHSITHSMNWNQTAYIHYDRSREDYSNE